MRRELGNHVGGVFFLFCFVFGVFEVGGFCNERAGQS